ncbi:SDR family oxidoreductase [Pseudoroseicyclus sp. CLL3-39]|uniref:SDR family oxidoreductase n=1 Tax=Pseudoroseicyclus tamaricis TaxID=2705421 RepID=A0A6B2JNC1_9RHOB|nr:SDR family oxidoreductase [Pseudoroseicyclus tamaricis]
MAVVTGAGSGLGRELAVALTGRGQRVAGLGRRAEALEETAARAGELFLPVPADVADPESLAEAFGRVRDVGPVSILINNAAVYPRADFLQESAGDFAAVMATNLTGYAAAAKEALRDMVAAGEGRILNVSSFAGVAPLAGSGAYSVSKEAGRALTRAMIADLGARFPRIVINDWMPGALNTGMGLATGLDPAVAAGWGATLALWQEPSLTGTTWEMDREIPPPMGLKRRVAAKVGMAERAPARRLG